MTISVDDRLDRLRSELDDHSRIARHLDVDLDRPLRSLADGYPENAISLIGKLAERLLKELWRHHEIEGDPSSKALNELIKRCGPHIRSATVLSALDDIRMLRNRSAHDGYEIAEEDGLLAVRRLVDVLAWFTSTGSVALTGGEPRMDPDVARRSEFLTGLYMTLGFRVAKQFVLSPHTVYQLLCREAGFRLEYVELLLSRDVQELDTVLQRTDGELLHTRLPKLTRFLIMDDSEPAAVARLLGQDYRCVSYQGFLRTLVDIEAHLAFPAEPAPAGGWERLRASALHTLSASGDLDLEASRDAYELLAELTGRSSNVLVVGRPGSGKSTLLRNLVLNADAGGLAPVSCFRFYFDLSLLAEGETFAAYVTRRLAPCTAIERERVFDLFVYLIRSGSALCVIDAVDEAVDEASPAGFLRLFADLAPVLSAESTVVMSSRVSFLADSPFVRQLLDREATPTEQLVEQMYANGVDPQRLPHFHLVRLIGTDSTPLERRLSTAVEARDSLPGLLDGFLDHVLAEAGTPGAREDFVRGFGSAYLRGKTVFTVLDLHRMLGADAFADGRLEAGAFRFRRLFRTAGQDALSFAHTSYQEFLAARHLADTRNEVASEGEAYVTEHVRTFRSWFGQSRTDDCLLPPGAYLVGPPERLLLRTVARPVRFDRHAVTVGRYRGFLDRLHADGTSPWDHPDQPARISHVPQPSRLSEPDYFTDERYDRYPVKSVSWWSAHAFARFENKRLPTALEWEAAARGHDGRLFPWGDSAEDPPVNCADTWAGRPLVTYQAWRTDFAQQALRQARAVAVDELPDNRSPIGVVGLSGNVWEWTSTEVGDPGLAAICGGSYDNPLRAVQASSKATYHKHGDSNAVGFRCVQDLEDPGAGS